VPAAELDHARAQLEVQVVEGVSFIEGSGWSAALEGREYRKGIHGKPRGRLPD
jgi:hypothetical protein